MRTSEGTARWKLVYSHPKGHRFFEDLKNPGKIAIADDSGHFPDQTDDGVLYLDTTRNIGLPADAKFILRLVDRDSTKSITIVGVDEARAVASMFRMIFDCPGY